MKKAIYPGSFDPITNGHIDVLKRALKVFDEVTIVVAINKDKKSKFTNAERVEMIESALEGVKGVKVAMHDGLSLDYAKQIGATCMIRGLRAVTDFEYEFQLRAANEYIDPEIDVVFFMSHAGTNFISSSTIDAMYKNGVDISRLVPNSVIEMYKRKAKN